MLIKRYWSEEYSAALMPLTALCLGSRKCFCKKAQNYLFFEGKCDKIKLQMFFRW